MVFEQNNSSKMVQLLLSAIRFVIFPVFSKSETCKKTKSSVFNIMARNLSFRGIFASFSCSSCLSIICRCSLITQNQFLKFNPTKLWQIIFTVRLLTGNRSLYYFKSIFNFQLQTRSLNYEESEEYYISIFPELALFGWRKLWLDSIYCRVCRSYILLM